MTQNVYEGGGPDQIEVIRLKAGDNWSKEVSKAFMNESIEQGSRVIDIGAGSSTDIEKWALEEKGASRYLAVDISESMLNEREKGLNKSYNHVISSATEMLNIEDKSFDIAHMKLVLMHLDKEEREKAISEAIRVAKKKVFFIDGDWTGWGGSELVDSYIDFIQNEINKYRKVDNYIGRKMKEEIESVAKKVGATVSRVTEFKQEAGNHYGYLIGLGKGTYRKLINERVSDVSEREKLLNKLDEYISKLEEEQKSGKLIEMASAVAVEVTL
jgi:ubiquinone/menaquinone biosynthesis C-methylase UbiE